MVYLIYQLNITLQSMIDCHQNYLQDAQLRETALKNALVSAKSGRLKLGDNILWTL